MRGFRIKFRSEEIVVTPDFRSSVTIFYNSSNGYELSVAGIKGFGDDALDTFWIKSDMHIGESIEIEIINADEQVCSSPTCVKKLDPNPLKLSEKQKQQMLDEYLKDFYRFDPTDNSWTRIEDFPGEARRDAVAFTLDNYGYVGTGRADKALLFKDFYCFDPKTETWNTNELGFKGDQRYGASAFVVGGAAYVCLGAKGSGYAQDVIKCTPLGEGKVSWDNMQALTDKPGVKQDKDYDRIPRAFAVSFVSNKGKDGENYAYIATGTGNSSSTVWKYNHKKDQWHQMEDLAPSAGNVVGAVSFVADGYGYYTTGGTSIDPIDAVSSSSTRYFTNSTWKFIPDIKETRRNDY